MEESKKNWHDKHHKTLLIIPAVLIIFSIVYLVIFHANTGDFIRKDISLTGGTAITIYDKVNVDDLEANISSSLSDLGLREIYDLTTREQKAVIVETTSSQDLTKSVLEAYLGYELVEGENSDFEFTGAILSNSFYKQLLIAILIAFLFMAIVVFILFKTAVPSLAVVISAFADILMTLVFFDLLGLKMSTAGIVAILMLIGYSVDTDIMLTTRLLKRREGSLNERLFKAFKTGITMTLTSFVAMFVALLVVKSFSEVLTQIFTILVIGLGFDILNTWITNVSILKWYVERKEKKWRKS
ncbi:preprotein translocase subunit SecF [Candidatus Pacearchaeota archaeon ex4484_71]|nr:MAG: preprotein translocase subunit SecF [Candidatus Pacearchaeota archaeon ex4484_71]